MRNIQWDEDIPPEYQGFCKKYLNYAYAMGFDEGYMTINQHGNKPVGKFDEFGQLVARYKSLKIAAKENRLSVKGIRKRIDDRQPMKRRGGFYWKYLNETESSPLS